MASLFFPTYGYRRIIELVRFPLRLTLQRIFLIFQVLFAHCYTHQPIKSNGYDSIFGFSLPKHPHPGPTPQKLNSYHYPLLLNDPT